MSAWRRLSKKQFPELKSIAASLETPIDLYVELSKLLNDGLDHAKRSLVQRVLKFALWGIARKGEEQFAQGTVFLFESVLPSDARRYALWQVLTRAQFDSFKEYFFDPISTAHPFSLKELDLEFQLVTVAKSPVKR